MNELIHKALKQSNDDNMLVYDADNDGITPRLIKLCTTVFFNKYDDIYPTHIIIPESNNCALFSEDIIDMNNARTIYGMKISYFMDCLCPILKEAIDHDPIKYPLPCDKYIVVHNEENYLVGMFNEV